jgi:nicotinate-nucleotide adenylyltransferase
MDRAKSVASGPRPLVLLYGGAFDPVHRGHLAMAAGAWAATGADRLCFLPAGQSPFKASGHASAAHRLAMLQRAVAVLPGAEIDDQELRRPGRSYTVETLRSLRARLGEDVALVWLLGADAAAGLPRWFEASALLQLVHVLVVARPGSPIPDLGAGPEPRFQRCAPGAFRDASAGRWASLDLGAFPEASHGIRARLAAGKAVDDLLPPAVSSYIAAQGLYGPPA